MPADADALRPDPKHLGSREQRRTAPAASARATDTPADVAAAAAAPPATKPQDVSDVDGADVDGVDVDGSDVDGSDVDGSDADAAGGPVPGEPEPVDGSEMSQVAAWMSALAQALDAGGDRLEPDAVARASAALERAGQRMELGAELTVVALVGATGSGKSSMFNALAGMEIAEVAARRPTTSEPTACVWGDGEADSLLDWLGVPLRNRTRRESVLDADSQAALHGLILLDLPDHDSAFLNHRLEVDRLLELVDLLIWVVDPQKYADEALHSGYLRPFSNRADVMLVVLNQIDKLSPEEAETCGRDLRRLLDADGLAEAPLLTTSARRGDGVPGLRDVLAGAVRQRASAVDRALSDLAASADNLRRGVGRSEPDLDEQGIPARLVAALAEAAGVPVVLDALEDDHRRRAGALLGWPFLRWYRRLRPDPLEQLGLRGAGTGLRELVGLSLPQPTPSQQAQVDLAARRVADAVASSLPPRWALAVRAASGWHRGGSGLSAALDAAVHEVDLDQGTPVWWTVVQVVQLLLAVVAAFGFAWLAVIGVLDWVTSVPSHVPFLGPLPLPTATLVGGLLVGGVLAPASRLLVDVGARRRRERLGERLNAAVDEIAQVWVLAPVRDVLDDHREVRESLAALR
jgi:GTP-binding protein EngB required for normal cell division